MLRIGITGGIGSGKTTVSHIFSTLGIPIYNADKRAKCLMQEDPVIKRDLVRLIGSKAYINNTSLNRPYIAQLIFSKPSLLHQINRVVHPAVYKDWLAWCTAHQAYDYALKEAAILIEQNMHKSLDALILVIAPEDIRISRVMNRDNLSRKQVKQRMENQLSDTDKQTYADYIISNDGKQSIIKQVLSIHQEILKQG